MTVEELNERLTFYINLLFKKEKRNEYIRSLVITIPIPFQKMIMLSHLCNVSPVVLTHHFTALTTSVTTLYTEERRKGISLFRCCGFGDISHLYAGGEEPSFSARFCEVYDNGDRVD